MSGRDEQAAYTPKVQLVKSTGANMVYDGSNDVAMINMRREANAQGLTGVDAWVCTVACYTEAFKKAGERRRRHLRGDGLPSVRGARQER